MESILPTARKSQKNSVLHRSMEACFISRILICIVQTVTAATVTRTDAPARRRMLYLQLITRIYKAVYFARIRPTQPAAAPSSGQNLPQIVMYILRKPFLDTLSFLNPWKTDHLYKPFSSHRPGPCHNGSPEYTGFFL